ncbi:hypothetical protein Acr_18g0006400 [Actinidia rufa]|uniref:Uncharacterized protein n=1 Tax=Actinidia rufa TaxID=165716 RepID=A0A7J0G6Q4_9ERIC|nr:hypothetical protein Acr_18g0006400 [Actinidia rufa]
MVVVVVVLEGSVGGRVNGGGGVSGMGVGTWWWGYGGSGRVVVMVMVSWSSRRGWLSRPATRPMRIKRLN